MDIQKISLKNVKKNWKNIISKLIHKYNIIQILNNEYSNNHICPNLNNIFETFKYFDIHDTKVILIGQDPYIGGKTINNQFICQAHGLAFSVPEILNPPPSLRNIFKELKNEIKEFEIPKNGNLLPLVKNENILLLNTSLTVIKGKSNSHKNIWNKFTNELIIYISKNTSNITFILLGKNAQYYQKFIDNEKHFIVTGIHPSPLSANRGFFNSNIFNKVNNILISLNKKPINWNILNHKT